MNTVVSGDEKKRIDHQLDSRATHRLFHGRNRGPKSGVSGSETPSIPSPQVAVLPVLAVSRKFLRSFLSEIDSKAYLLLARGYWNALASWVLISMAVRYMYGLARLPQASGNINTAIALFLFPVLLGGGSNESVECIEISTSGRTSKEIARFAGIFSNGWGGAG